MQNSKRIFLTVLTLWMGCTVVCSAQDSSNIIIKTVKAGNWTDPTTWNGERIPDRFDSIVVLHPLVIDIDAECSYMKAGNVQVSISPGKSLKIFGVKPELRPNAYIIDSNLLRLVSSPPELENGVYKLKFSGAAPSISIGKVLVSDWQGGYLRKVTGVAIKADTIVAQTVQAAMEEVFEKANFTIYYDGSSMNEVATAPNIPSQHEAATKFTYNFSNQKLLEYGLSRLDLKNAKVELYPAFQFDYDFGLSGLQLFEMKMKNATLRSEMEFDLKLGVGQKSVQDTLKRFTKVFTKLVGPVPVAVEAELMFIAKAEIELSGVSFNRVFKYQFDYQFDANARYENNAWSTGFNAKDFHDSLTYTDKTDLSAQVSVKVTITPKLSFRLYTLAGPYIQFPTSITLTGRYFHPNSTWDFGALAKSTIDWGGDIKIGKRTVDNYGPYKLWTKDWFNYQSPYRLAYISGDGQTFSDTSQYLTDSIKVRVLDSWDYAWKNVPVFFQLRQAGTLTAQKVYTDTNGYAAIRWKPGAGEIQMLDVSIKNGIDQHIVNSPLTFSTKTASDTFQVLKVYNQANTSAFTSNIFKTIAKGKNGTVWAGTNGQGLYKLSDTIWTKWNFYGTVNYQQMMIDKNMGVWIAQSGSGGSAATTGGTLFFPDSSFNNFSFYGVTQNGMPSNSVRGIFVDTNRYNGPTTLPVVWTSCYATSGGSARPGGIGRGSAPTLPEFYSIKTGIDIDNTLKTGGVFYIAGDSTEIWSFATNNFGKSQLIRHSAKTDAFIGAYDATNIPNNLVTDQFQARAIYFDTKGNKWVAVNGIGVLVLDQNGVWKLMNDTALLTASPLFNINAITGDSFGNVYFGTNYGLLKYKAGNPINVASSYKLYTTANGLPSSSIQAVFIDDSDKKIYLGTSAGVVICKGD